VKINIDELKAKCCCGKTVDFGYYYFFSGGVSGWFSCRACGAEEDNYFPNYMGDKDVTDLKSRFEALTPEEVQDAQ
jgi:hypothetical protein